MQKRIECNISGRVQLVMYRDFATRTARRLGIVGFVKNRKDGKVYLVAEGEESSLHFYVTALRKGSLLSRVDSVDEVWMLPTNEFTRFVIQY